MSKSYWYVAPLLLWSWKWSCSARPPESGFSTSIRYGPWFHNVFAGDLGAVGPDHPLGIGVLDAVELAIRLDASLDDVRVVRVLLKARDEV
ncbi:hypothetical protein AMK20_02340 [Streptomyces sp. TSRI0261]|nr:hypothetical protein AMK20_02340 [Streptomyces sp. TSRI0261]